MYRIRAVIEELRRGTVDRLLRAPAESVRCKYSSMPRPVSMFAPRGNHPRVFSVMTIPSMCTLPAANEGTNWHSATFSHPSAAFES